MTISKDLFLSLLSMDAYNRGYGAGIDGLSDNINTGIGSAKVSETIASTSIQNLAATAQAAGFYAIAYNDPTYGTVISYRGTDQGIFELFPVDLPLSVAGSYRQEQILLAQKFFDAADGANGSSPMLLTGHSLGGALAGLVLH